MLTQRDFSVDDWTCLVVHDPMYTNGTDTNMISGVVLEVRADNVLISTENVVGPNDDLAYQFEDIHEKVV